MTHLKCVTDLGLQPWEPHSDPEVPTWQRHRFPAPLQSLPRPSVLGHVLFLQKKLDGMFCLLILKLHDTLFSR